MENQSAKESVAKIAKESRKSEELVVGDVVQLNKDNAVLYTGDWSVNITHTATINHTVITKPEEYADNCATLKRIM